MVISDKLQALQDAWNNSTRSNMTYSDRFWTWMRDGKTEEQWTKDAYAEKEREDRWLDKQLSTRERLTQPPVRNAVGKAAGTMVGMYAGQQMKDSGYSGGVQAAVKIGTTNYLSAIGLDFDGLRRSYSLPPEQLHREIREMDAKDRRQGNRRLDLGGAIKDMATDIAQGVTGGYYGSAEYHRSNSLTTEQRNKEIRDWREQDRAAPFDTKEVVNAFAKGITGLGEAAYNPTSSNVLNDEFEL